MNKTCIEVFPNEFLKSLLFRYWKRVLSQNELLTYLWYLNLECTLRGLEVIQKFNNDNNDNEDQYRYVILKITTTQIR